MNLHLHTAGRHAVHVLEGTAAGRLVIMAVFERSLYAESSCGTLLCFGHPSLAPGPITLLCTQWPGPATQFFAPGQLIQAARAAPAQNVGTAPHATKPAAVIIADACRIWEPEPLPRFSPHSLKEGLRMLRVAVPAHAPDAGFAPLLPLLLGVAPRAVPQHGAPARADAITENMLLLASEGLEQLSRSLTGESDDTAARQAVRMLLGLGMGLTPSGDDVLGGVLVALHSLGATHLAARLSRHITELAPAATNRISQAHLAAAMTGQASAPLHRALNTVLSARASLPDDLQALAGMGHSSGWDAFLGCCLVLLAAAHNCIFNDKKQFFM